MSKTQTRSTQDGWITLTAAAKIVGKSRQVIPAMVGRQELSGKTFGGRLFVSRSSAERYRAEDAARKAAA